MYHQLGLVQSDALVLAGDRSVNMSVAFFDWPRGNALRHSFVATNCLLSTNANASGSRNVISRCGLGISM
jgi:hypothetical protein